MTLLAGVQAGWLAASKLRSAVPRVCSVTRQAGKHAAHQIRHQVQWLSNEAPLMHTLPCATAAKRGTTAQRTSNKNSHIGLQVAHNSKTTLSHAKSAELAHREPANWFACTA